MTVRFRAKLLAITGEPHDIILHTRTESTEIDVVISQSMFDLIKGQMLAMEKKINKEPVS